jgi:tetratricopeptide (TPR) repeat protein
VNVESVAWITQRKNLVAMLFYLLSIYGFIRWSAPTPARLPPDALEPARRGRRAPPGIWYALSLLAFGLAMLSKGSVAILPLVLLGILAWDRRIAAKDLVRLAPFFLVAGALALVDVWFQKHHLVGNEVIRHAGWLERLLGAGAAVWFYLGKALLPVRLAFFYPLWHIESASVGWWLPLLGAIGLTLFLWRKNRVSSPSFVIPSAARNLPFAATEIPRSARNGQITGYGIWRGALFAWGYFCVALVPVLGFTDVYFMKFSLVANHYQHLALIGVTTLAGAAWAGAMNERRKPGMSESRKSGLNESRKPALILAAVAVVGLLAILTWRQCRNYRDPETLMVATLEENPGSALAHENLGVILGNTHRLPEAMAQLEEALRLQPGFADADSNLGALLVEQGRIPEGMAHYQAALRSNPDLFVVHLNLGSLLLYQHRWEEARSELQTAVRLRPASADARALLARAQQAATGVTGAAAGAPGAAAGNPSFP